MNAVLLTYELGNRSTLEQLVRGLGRSAGIDDLRVTKDRTAAPVTITIFRGNRK